MPTVQSNGIEIAYETAGSGPPLVLISGVGYGAWFWQPLVPLLAEAFTVLTFDNRGAGGSTKADGPYTVPMLAEDTAGLMDALEIHDAAVCGHSLGGFIAQELAIRRPELVGKLILASTNHGGADVVPITPEALAVMLNREGDPVDLVRRGIAIAAAPGFLETSPETVQTLIEYRLTNPVPPPQYSAQVMAGAGMSAFTPAQVAERMAALDMPVLILFGEEDKVVPPGNARLMNDKIRDAQVRILPGTGHIFPIEDPRAAAEAILAFTGQNP